MKNSIDAICVLSGPSAKVDIQRAQTGVDYARRHGLSIPFRILGAGPDL